MPASGGHFHSKVLRQEQFPIKQKKRPENRKLFFRGRWWIRTTESVANRFTVCPLWPLGKPPV